MVGVERPRSERASLATEPAAVALQQVVAVVAWLVDPGLGVVTPLPLVPLARRRRRCRRGVDAQPRAVPMVFLAPRRAVAGDTVGARRRLPTAIQSVTPIPVDVG